MRSTNRPNGFHRTCATRAARRLTLTAAHYSFRVGGARLVVRPGRKLKQRLERVAEQGCLGGHETEHGDELGAAGRPGYIVHRTLLGQRHRALDGAVRLEVVQGRFAVVALIRFVHVSGGEHHHAGALRIPQEPHGGDAEEGAARQGLRRRRGPPRQGKGGREVGAGGVPAGAGLARSAGGQRVHPQAGGLALCLRHEDPDPG